MISKLPSGRLYCCRLACHRSSKHKLDLLGKPAKRKSILHGSFALTTTKLIFGAVSTSGLRVFKRLMMLIFFSFKKGLSKLTRLENPFCLTKHSNGNLQLKLSAIYLQIRI